MIFHTRNRNHQPKLEKIHPKYQQAAESLIRQL